MGTADWDEGFSCGTCVELEYQGNTITVNVVDRWGVEEHISPEALRLYELFPYRF